MTFEYTYDRKAFGAVSIKTVRCMPVSFKCPVEHHGELLSAPAGVIYQIQENQFVSQGKPQVFYQPPYFGSPDPLYPDLSLEDGFNKLLTRIHCANHTDPLVLYGLISETGPVIRGPIYIVKARDPAPLVLLDAICGGRLAQGGIGCTCEREHLSEAVLERIANLEFWENEIIYDEQIYGRPRRRYYR